MRYYFDLELAGVSESQDKNSENALALKILNETSQYVDGAWEVGLLWKSGEKTFSSGRSTALRRLFLLERKLDNDLEYAKLYYEDMARLFENGFAVQSEKFSQRAKTRYLPHFGVTNINKPGRVRLVFDAAVKSNTESFNDL